MPGRVAPGEPAVEDGRCFLACQLPRRPSLLAPHCTNNPSRRIPTLGRRSLSVDYGSSLRRGPPAGKALRRASYLHALADVDGAEGLKATPPTPRQAHRAAQLGRVLLQITREYVFGASSLRWHCGLVFPLTRQSIRWVIIAIADARRPTRSSRDPLLKLYARHLPSPAGQCRLLAGRTAALRPTAARRQARSPLQPGGGFRATKSQVRSNLTAQYGHGCNVVCNSRN